MVRCEQRETADEDNSDQAENQNKKPYEIKAVRFEDHIRVVMTSPTQLTEIIVALPDKTQSSYIGLTGECCKISDIVIEVSQEDVDAEKISRIVNEVSYIDCLESDIRNVQSDRTRSAFSVGMELQDKDKLEFMFQSMSLPSASLIWHCPAVVIYSSDDGAVYGPNFREYALIKLNGEIDDQGIAQNRFRMRRKENFPGWDKWKKINKEGLEYVVSFERKGERVILKTNNCGIEIENTTTIPACPSKVYVALTGDQVALTDIRIR